MDSSEETAVVARYLARHSADIACAYLEDQDIRAFVLADDVHVPLQYTEGVRLIVMESDRDAAHAALSDAGLLPEDMAPDVDPDEDEAADDEPIRLAGARSTNGSAAPGPAPDSAAAGGRRGIVVGTTIAIFFVALVFFVPWRIEGTNELRWAPFYRAPIAENSVYERLGEGEISYESGAVAYDILLFQLLVIVVVGGISGSVIRAMSTAREREEVADAPTNGGN